MCATSARFSSGWRTTAAIDLIRRRGTRDKTREQFAAEIISPFAPASDPDEQTFRAALAEALAELPPDQRAVVHLKLWEGLTFEQIAEALDIPLNTAASRYRYGVRQIARAAASIVRRNQIIFMAAIEYQRKHSLNAGSRRTRRSVKESNLIFSANLCVLCVSALKTIPAK